MGALRWFGFAAGIVVLAVTAASLRTLIVPRGFSSRLTLVVENVVNALFLAISDRFAHYRQKDRVLALQGPVSLAMLLLVWLGLFLLGYALVIWPLSAHESFAHALAESGSSLFTLGFVAEPGAGVTTVNILAAATGLIVIALQIAYLPALYAAFNRRETLVGVLQSRAGIPAWGPEILARHQLVHTTDALPALYAEWERWAADVGESHSNYPVLIYFRSPHPLRNWLLALLAVMDSAALHESLAPGRAPSEARLLLRMGFTTLREIADVVGVSYDPDPLPTAAVGLTYEDFLEGVKRLEKAGFAMERTADEGWPHFRGWRVNYESVAYALADRILAPPGMWSGARTRLPGLVIPPLRPVDRSPVDPKEHERPVAPPEWKI